MKLPPWSHSSLNQYKTCPAQYEALRISKRFPREDGEASLWGKEVHEALEKRIRDAEALPERMRQYEAYASSLAAGWADGLGGCDIFTELELGVLEDGSACEFDAEDCWARCIVDYLRIKGSVALCLDHKTGKRREGSPQLKMSAGLIFARFPQLERIICGYAWLQEGGKMSREEYKREDCEAIWRSFGKDLEELAWSYETGNWPTRPSGLCNGWCSVRDCIYWQEKRVKR